MSANRDPLLLLDTASLYFRAFYGVPDKVRADDGTPINAARGLLDMIAKLSTTFHPERVIACWDDDWRPQWRVDLIPSYKTHRVEAVVEGGPDVEEVPDPLLVQIPLIRSSLAALGIDIIGAAEHEADDVIGSLASQVAGPVDVVTGDRDLFQLVDDATDVRVVYTGRGMSNLRSSTTPRSSASTGYCRRSTPTSPSCVATRPTACRALRVWARRPLPRCWVHTAISLGSCVRHTRSRNVRRHSGQDPRCEGLPRGCAEGRRGRS